MTDKPTPEEHGPRETQATWTRVRGHDGRTKVWIAGGRQSRPNLPGVVDCPFCPGGLEAPAAYETKVIANRWPVMPHDRCEVVLYSPDHDETFASLGVEGVVRVIDLWAERTEELGSRPDVVAVLPFENRGAEVGATIPHPHGQLYAFDEVPPAIADELAAESCSHCADLAAERIVATGPGWRSWIPQAARYPFEIAVAPTSHVPDLVGADQGVRRDLALAMMDAITRLDALFDAPMPYMLWVHQRPTDAGSWPLAHLHVEIVGLYRSPGTPRYVAAAEMGSGVWLNTIPPADAAAMLRAAL